MEILPLEIISLIITFLPYNNIRNWIILAKLTENDNLFQELKSSYFNMICRFSPQEYILYDIYFRINNINKWKLYIENVYLFNAIFQKKKKIFKNV